MNCMKCGIEIEDGQVFCESCLSDMKRYPVKPGARIQLPSRPTQEAVKKPVPRKKMPTPEEKILRLRNVIKWLSAVLIISLLFLGFSVYMLTEQAEKETPQDNIGQNYNTVEQDDQ